MVVVVLVVVSGAASTVTVGSGGCSAGSSTTKAVVDSGAASTDSSVVIVESSAASETSVESPPHAAMSIRAVRAGRIRRAVRITVRRYTSTIWARESGGRLGTRTPDPVLVGQILRLHWPSGLRVVPVQGGLQASGTTRRLPLLGAIEWLVCGWLQPYSTSMKMHSPGHSSADSMTASTNSSVTAAVPAAIR